jgi:hypothetical protein
MLITYLTYEDVVKRFPTQLQEAQKELKRSRSKYRKSQINHDFVFRIEVAHKITNDWNVSKSFENMLASVIPWLSIRAPGPSAAWFTHQTIANAEPEIAAHVVKYFLQFH